MKPSKDEQEMMKKLPRLEKALHAYIVAVEEELGVTRGNSPYMPMKGDVGIMMNILKPLLTAHAEFYRKEEAADPTWAQEVVEDIWTEKNHGKDR